MKLEEFKKIIELAVSNEIEAYEFYKSAAEKVKNDNLKSTFKELAEEELKHKLTLKAFLDGSGKPLAFDETHDYKVSETVDKPKMSTDMKFADAIALAMKNEEEAMNMYNEFAKSSADEEQKEMFLNLAKMEQGHKVKLEELYTNAAYAEVW